LLLTFDMELKMFEKLKDLYAVFRTGEMVANPTAWKKGQMTGGLVAGLLGALVALAKAFGHEIPLTDEQLLQIGGAVVAIFGVFNAGATVVSTDKLGLSTRCDNAAATGDSDGAQRVPAESPATAPENKVQPVRRAANGDVLDGLDTTYTGG
jgi:predicted lipid-binding transport protein (Tim44 family)